MKEKAAYLQHAYNQEKAAEKAREMVRYAFMLKF